MPGLGTIVNVGAIIVGGLIGMVGGRFFKERFQKILMDVCGITTIVIGLAGVLSKMLVVTEEGISTQGIMMMIGSFAIGSLLGELINLDLRMEQFAGWLKVKTKNEKDSGFINAFVTASLTVCIGAMAIVGSIQDGLLGDHSTLFAKAILDLIIIIIMTASMGKGCIFSAIPVAVLQGVVTLLSRFLQPVLTDAAINNLSLTGSVMIFCVGLNLIRDKRIKVANMLPTLIVAVVWSFFQ